MSNIDLIKQQLSVAGKQAIPYIDLQNPARPLVLHTYRPIQYTPDSPVVIVQHGVLRNGDEYRDFWIPAADKYGLLIVAVTFSNEYWPGVEFYNNGCVWDEHGSLRAPNTWSYAIIERVVNDLFQSGITRQQQVYLFGHSAGGQFVHRLMSSQDHGCFKAASAGNPGWYTLPSFDYDFPEGLAKVGLDTERLKKLLTYPLTILAGDQDIETDDPYLPSGPEALSQGPHRFARAHHYFKQGQLAAQALGIECAWRLQEVPGIGHDGQAMSEVMACLWFEGKMPSESELQALAGARVA